MAKRMLIDATHPEETRVVVVNGNRLEEFDFESSTKQQVKGNIYLAKVTRVEPSLQAAFVEYGGNRHGFLAFSEIHPDYFRIPIGDRNLVVIGMDFRERQKPVSVAAVVEECRLQRRLDARYLGEIDIAPQLLAVSGFEIEFLNAISAQYDHPGFLRMRRIDEHLVCH